MPKDTISGLDIALKVLHDIEDISVIHLTSDDVVRHPLVQRIVNAYEVYEEKQAKKNQSKDNKTYQKKDR